ncbi:MAG: DUF928 domain-containing protein [Jaaginema sp. PMC 1079.18]|nr:DUF928 domain-containing protein [Jaaginema sp. PMC 1080.18]MEC4853217.1 DUF928 domain-containing protein [Jaaginema sp. PMC 1079.18]MEC4867866.1 DUF928 domain-containing protein [Jaaginema sp. PMC 1078.18]
MLYLKNQVFAIASIASFVALSPSPLLAQNVWEIGSEPLQFTPPSLPSGTTGRPIKRRDAGSSSSCEIANSNNGEFLTALVPKKDREAVTISDRPTFWFYIPFAANEFHSLKFRLQTEDGYQVTLTPTSPQPGVIKVTLPESEPALNPNKTYRWGFFLYCQNPDVSSRVPITFFVGGTVTRILPDATLQGQIEATGGDRDLVALYAQQGLWYDALTLMGDRYSQNPDNPHLRQDWQDLLESVELTDVAAKPIVSISPDSTD